MRPARRLNESTSAAAAAASRRSAVSPDRSAARRFAHLPGRLPGRLAGLAAGLAAAALLALAGCSGDDGGRDGRDRAAARDSAAARDTAATVTTAEIVAAQEQFRLEDTAGRWSRVRPGVAAPLTAEQRRRMRELESLGYVAGSRPASALAGVVRHDRDRARAGYNLYTSGHAPEAVLMDMDGRVLHRWARPYREVWPDSAARRHPDHDFWRRARLLPGGELLAIVDGFGILKLDRDSRVLWARHNGAHHDLELLPGGEILVLTREARVIRRVHPRDPVLVDFIVRLDRDGHELQRASLLEAFENSPEYGAIWQRARKRTGDVFHTNSLELLDGRAAHRHPAFTAGGVLVSIRELDTIAVVELETPAVIWAMQGPFAAQHDATVLDDGTIMLFDNEDGPGVSAVEVYDPATARERWRFAGTPARPFYSRTCGTSQPLAGGHVLVTESDNGRAFEITREGEVVWDFYNPHRAGERDEFIATLFELRRLPADLDLGWLGAAGENGVH
jgi:hypothetical protein